MESDARKRELLLEEEIISLQEIMEAFSAPLNEEQAWAICYQCGKYLEESGERNVYVEGTNGILLRQDGNVRLMVDVQNDMIDNSRETQIMVLNALGRTIYHALDYGLSEEEERELSHPLEELIEFMTAADINNSHDDNSNDNNNVGARPQDDADSFNVDEGIEDEELCEEEREDGERGRSKRDDAKVSSEDDIEDESSIIPQLLKLCSDHLPQPTAASTHYQAVCRAVYTEYLDLATFLTKISGSKEILRNLSDRGDECDGNVEDLQPRQWAKIWLNVLRDLRNGVKLKKLSDHEKGRAPIEYALTPYEMLMDDIRSHRFTLNKVIVDGRIPASVKKEAHDIILDFIRSRPPLKPVPQDKLNQKPLRRESVHEKIMNEIRSQPQLKPAPVIEKSEARSQSGIFSEESGEEDDSPQLAKKVLKAEFSLEWSEEESDSETSRHESDSYPVPRRRVEEEIDGVQERRDVDDDDGEDILERAIQKILDDGQHLDQTFFLDVRMPPDTMVSTPEKTLTMSRSSLSSFEEIRSDEIPRQNSPRRHTIGPCQSFQSARKPCQSVDCLSLTVEEVVHIRSVLVKAEIENLRVNAKLHRDVLQDKVCFSCKQKFFLFKKKFKCRLCKKLICSVCCVKMFIPKEDFLHIPIESLTPDSPKKSPSTPTRQRSISEPPTPFLQSSPLRERKLRERHVWRRPSQVDNVCCECCTFLKNTRTGPSPSEATKRFPVPFSLAPPPLYSS